MIRFGRTSGIANTNVWMTWFMWAFQWFMSRITHCMLTASLKVIRFWNPDLPVKIPCWSRGPMSIRGPSEVPADCEFRKEDLVLACTPASLYHNVSSPGSRLWVLVSGIVLDEQAYGSGNEIIIFCLMWSSLCDSIEMMSSCNEENPSKPKLPKS